MTPRAKRCPTVCRETGDRCIERGPHSGCVYSEEQRQLRDSVASLYRAQRDDIAFYRQEARDAK